MQTPAACAINEVGQFVPEDRWTIVFTPSFPCGSVHMASAAYLTTALAMGAVRALHVLRDRFDLASRNLVSMAMWMLIVVTPLQILADDFHRLNTLDHQPAKMMAMEGHYEMPPRGCAADPFR